MYIYRVSAADAAGNTEGARIDSLRIDTRSTPVRLLTQAGGFSPNGDKNQDIINFSTYVGVKDGIAAWRFDVVDVKNNARIAVRNGGMSSTVPADPAWDGKNKNAAAKEGVYYAELSVDFEKGNVVQTRSAEFLLDISPPKAALTIRPKRFSPDSDGTNDTLIISMTAEDRSPIEGWELSIIDPMEHLFVQYTGKNAPSGQIVWDGKSPDGELVQAASNYKAVYRVRDSLGNGITISDIIPIDVLVMIEGDRLRIQISSIFFAPFTTEFQPGKEEENRKTLNRIAEILKKYGQCKITL